MIQVGEERELRLKKQNPTRAILLHQEEQQKDSGHPRRKRQGKGAQSLFTEVRAENVPNLGRNCIHKSMKLREHLITSMQKDLLQDA